MEVSNANSHILSNAEMKDRRSGVSWQRVGSMRPAASSADGNWSEAISLFTPEHVPVVSHMHWLANTGDRAWQCHRGNKTTLPSSYLWGLLWSSQSVPESYCIYTLHYSTQFSPFTPIRAILLHHYEPALPPVHGAGHAQLTGLL